MCDYPLQVQAPAHCLNDRFVLTEVVAAGTYKDDLFEDNFGDVVCQPDRVFLTNQADFPSLSDTGKCLVSRRIGVTGSVNGFVNDLTRQFPMEYSVELKRLIDLEMEGSVG